MLPSGRTVPQTPKPGADAMVVLRDRAVDKGTHMKQAPTLVVLAAGIGSRYGGLKQIDPVGPNGEIVLDYSVFDARRAGFGKVVFVIRPELEAAFREHFRTVAADIDLHYCHQLLDDLPAGHCPPAHRDKPWGTAHAVRAARHAVDEPFAVINADDFYGRQSFRLLGGFLMNPPRTEPPTYAMVAFRLDNTLSKHGTVARGICATDAAGALADVEEHVGIRRDADGAIRGRAADGQDTTLQPDSNVSMNMWGFTPGFFDDIDPLFERFLRDTAADPKAEFYLPWVVDRLIKRERCTVSVLPTPDTWFGVTYREDRDDVRRKIARLTEAGAYPVSPEILRA